MDEAKEHMEYMARMKRVFDEVFDKTEFRVNAYPVSYTHLAEGETQLQMTRSYG